MTPVTAYYTARAYYALRVVVLLTLLGALIACIYATAARDGRLVDFTETCVTGGHHVELTDDDAAVCTDRATGTEVGRWVP